MNMQQHNPMHPGEFIRQGYLEPLEIKPAQASRDLGVSPSAFSRLLNGQSDVSTDMALRLEKAFGRSAESWLAMQDNFDLWQARQSANLDAVKPIYQPAQ